MIDEDLVEAGWLDIGWTDGGGAVYLRPLTGPGDGRVAATELERHDVGAYWDAGLATTDPDVRAVLAFWAAAVERGWSVRTQPDRDGWKATSPDGTAGVSFRAAGTLGVSMASMHDAEQTMTLTGASLGEAAERMWAFLGWGEPAGAEDGGAA